MKRRDFLRTTAAAFAGLGIASPFAPWGARPAVAAEKLTVTHFGGPYAALDELVAKPFEAAGLGNVVYEQELSTTALGKLQTGAATFDVSMLSRTVALRAARAGLVQKINLQAITNLGSTIEGTVLGDAMGVAMVMDSIDVMYVRSQVPNPITSWVDLWRPELSGKIALPSTKTPIPLYLIASLCKTMGGSEKDASAVNAAFAKFKELKQHVRTFYTDPNQASVLIDRGDVAVAPQYSIRIGAVMRNNKDVVRATPKEGVAAQPYDLVLVKSSKKAELAQKYINFILSEPVQSGLAEGLLATPVKRTVAIPSDVASLVMTDASRLNFFDEEYITAKQTEWFTRWEREIQS
jgi:putative spermidine/putrescine transport system substrate-binding protein